MSAVYWLQFRRHAELETDQEDLYLLCRETENLDRLCEKLDVLPISHFTDSTDAAYNAGVFDDRLEPEDLESDEPPYNIEQMRWFDPTDGLNTMRALRIFLLEHSKAMSINTDDQVELIDELERCIAQLETAPLEGKSAFHLQLLM